jgi:hypothetical protein
MQAIRGMVKLDIEALRKVYGQAGNGRADPK